MEVSEVAFNSLPQAIRDWFDKLGWKREDITFVHVRYTKPAIFTAMKDQEKHYARLEVLADGKWAKEIIDEDQEALEAHVAQVNADLAKQ